MDEIRLRCVNLNRHYIRGTHTVRALDGVDLELRAGEFLALVGASGSGRSTLLNLAAGLDCPSAGRVLMGLAIALGILVAVLAGSYPAHRASRVDPVEALRQE